MRRKLERLGCSGGARLSRLLTGERPPGAEQIAFKTLPCNNLGDTQHEASIVMHTTNANRAETSKPDHCDHVPPLDPPPLLESEERTYEQHLAEVSQAVRPRDFLEHLW